MAQNFEWYQIINSNKEITQGDILEDILIMTSIETESPPYYKSVGFPSDVIVMTQACDIQQGKVEYINLCRLLPLDELIVKHVIKNSNDQATANITTCGDLVSGQRKIGGKFVESLIQGNIVNYYLLENNDILKNRVVDVSESFKMPIKSLYKTISDLEDRDRLRLQPPYREHLAQHYANTFGRIGLPFNLNRDEIFRRYNLTK